MARYRDRGSNDDEPVRGVLDERRRLLAAASLTGAVVVVLVLGFILRTDDPGVGGTPQDSGVRAEVRESASHAGAASELRPARAPVEAPVENLERPPATRPEPRVEPPAPARPTAVAPPTASLDDRTGSDAARLRDAGGEWTVQLMVACDPDNARRIVDLADGSADLYVLPVMLDGRRCYRVCWGSYTARATADSHRDLPAALGSEIPDRQVRAVDDVAP